MKYILKLFLSFFFVITVISCSLNNKVKQSSITILLPGNNSREAEITDNLTYVLEVQSSTEQNNYIEEGTGGDVLSIAVPAGTYNVQLKAYAQNDENKATVLYEASKNDVEVLEDNETKIFLTLLRQLFDITVVDDDNSTITTFKIKRNNIIDSQLNDFTKKENYDFEGWFDGDELFDFTTKITKDITLIGKWKKINQKDEEKTEDDTENKIEEVENTIPETEDGKKEDTITEPVESEVIEITEGITIQALNNGFEIKVAKVENSNDWTWAKVEEVSTQTTYDLYPALDKLNRKETITFLFPYVIKNKEYEFKFSHPDIENGQVTHKMKAVGGTGELDYSDYNKLKPEISFDSNGSCVVSVDKLNKNVTSFLEDSKATFFFRIYGSNDEFNSQTSFICEKTDSIDGEDGTHFYYDMLDSGYVNFADAENYYWNDSSTLGDTLNLYSQYFVQIGYYFNSTDNGRFQTRLIESKACNRKE